MSVYPSPCGCNQNVIQVVTTTCPTTCLDLQKIIVGPTITEQLPCGVSGPVNQLDIPALSEVDVSVCVGTLSWLVVEYDSTIFSQASVDANGVLSFKFSELAAPNDVHTILMKAICDNPALSAFFKVLITVGDICFNATCDPITEVCDPCTKACGAAQVDIAVNVE